MSTLWNPRRPLNQPPHYGHVTAAAEQSKPFDHAADKAAEAIYPSQSTRRKRSDKSVFDRSTKGSR
jgi:hypothetical protein